MNWLAALLARLFGRLTRRRCRSIRPSFRQRHHQLESLEARMMLAVDISIGDVRVNEDAGYADFSVQLSEPSMQEVTVDWATADGTASSVAGADFTAASGTFTFSMMETSKTVSVTLTNDTDKESDQTFKIDLSNAVGGTIVDSQGVATIVDDDATGMTNTPDIIVRAGNELFAGDVAYAYELPSGHTLRYQSITNAQPIIAVETVQPEESAIPDSIKTQLTFDGNTDATIYYNTDDLTAGDSQRWVAQFDASALASGSYDWSLLVTETHGSEIATRTFTGTRSIINYANSEFGQQWILAGLDHVAVDTDWATVIYSDGGTARFDLNNGIYQTPDQTTSTLSDNGDGTYTLEDKYGGKSDFDSGGNLTQRTDRFGNATTYSYSAA